MKALFDERTRTEERWNAVSHGVALFVMLTLSAECIAVGKVMCYSLALTFLFSVLYHSASETETKRHLRKLDMASIHISIASTGASWCLLVGSPYWAISAIPSLVGFIVIVVWYGRPEVERMMVPLSIGPAAVIIALFVLSKPSIEQVSIFLAGNVFYLIGTLFYLRDSRPWYHTVWHCFVLLGAATHSMAFFQ